MKVLLSLELAISAIIFFSIALASPHASNKIQKRAAITIHDRPAVPHNATLHQRNSFKSYGGCSKKYGGSTGENIIKSGYRDMLQMTGLVNPFLTNRFLGIPYQAAAGVMEKRFFGDVPKSNEKRDQIKTIFRNAANWYPWSWDYFDWRGDKIEVFCEQDQPNPYQNVRCGKQVDGGEKPIAAYALSLGGKAQIIFCAPFFSNVALNEKQSEIEKNPDLKKKLPWFRTRAHVVFHEMTHLHIMGYTDVIDMNQNPYDQTGRRVYGAELVEAFAKRFPQYTHKNADTYAWYATAMWFRQFWGDPDPTPRRPVPIGGEPDPLPQPEEFTDDFYNDGRTPTDGETSNPNPTLHSYQEISDDEAIAFSAGDYTPFGFLGGKKLRILPLGDSITYGFKSSDGNGYRQALKTILEGTGNTVEMIGTVQAGTMANNNNEGHNAATIDQVATYTGAYGQRPNVILLHVGTNDLNLHLDPSSAPQRLDSLVEKLISACPDATIIVARIIPSTDSGLASLISEYNKAITERMRDRALRREQNVIIVDMPSGVRVQDMADGLHPSDAGYDKMAVKWAIALTAANSMGWVQDPVAPTEVSVPSAPSCEREVWWMPQGEIASGGGLGANTWLSSSCTLNAQTQLCNCQKQEVPLTQELFQSTKKCDIEMVKSPTATAVHFADLNGDGRVEYLHVDSIGAVTAFLNLGSPNQGGEAGKVTWLPQGTIATGVGGTRGSVQFADINGDGRAEYLWVHEDGSVDCWLNLGGPDNGPNAGKVGWLPQGTIATGIGKDGAGVRFADINGDGRAEYLYVYEDGSVEAYLNAGGPDNGPNAAKVIWLPQGKIATGVGMGRENVIFADVNGDKRADYLAVSRTDGSVKLWRNGGPLDKGSNDAKVVWIERGTIATGVGTNGKGVQFADLNGDRRAEYMDVAYDTSAVNAWLNGC